MGKLIAILGPSGVGKTALTRALAATGIFDAALETHETRPYQERFSADPRYALHNQVDYLLFRAEQERALRNSPRPGVLDGGLEMDFYGFTRLFHKRGWLEEEAFSLCARLYETLRRFLPPPELFLRLTAREETIRRRLARRDRINIASAEDILLLDSFVDDYLKTLPDTRVLRLDVSEDDPSYRALLARLLPPLRRWAESEDERISLPFLRSGL